MRNSSRDTKLAVASTKQLMDIPLRITNTGPSCNNLWIPMCKPCQYEPKEIPLDPYLLGLLEMVHFPQILYASAIQNKI